MAQLNVKNVKVSNGVWRLPWGSAKSRPFNERVLLESHQVNSTGGWVVNDWANSGYTTQFYKFDIELVNLKCVTDNTNTMMETYWTNAPTTANSTVAFLYAGREMWVTEAANTSAVYNGTGTAAVHVHRVLGNDTSSALNGNITIWNPFDTTKYKFATWDTYGWDVNNGVKAYDHVGVIYNTSGTYNLDGVGFFGETDPTKIFDEGHINLYGYPIGG